MSRSGPKQPDYIYEIFCKFILNLPSHQLQPQRVWFHYQKAYFYYVDHVRSKKKKFNEFDKQSEKQFYQKLISIAPKKFLESPLNLMNIKNHYYDTIPVFGAILLNEEKTKVIMVLSKQNQKYSFPKGKIDEGQNPIDCAIRQVWQQVGYNITYNVSHTQYITVDANSKKPTVFFLARNIKQTYKFYPQQITEVQKVEWFLLQSVQTSNGKLNKVTRKALKELNSLLSITPQQMISTKVQQNQNVDFLSDFQSFISSYIFEFNSETSVPKENPFLNFDLGQRIANILK